MQPKSLLAVAFAVVTLVPAGAFAAQLAAHPTVDPVPLGGPSVDATIIRDAWGVPHIYADDVYSLFYANGYAQAQDRLAQMEILRHVGRGELAALTGPSGLELDLVTRRELYTHDERVAAFHALPQEWQDAFTAFADGVNAWIAEIRLDPTKLPVEYPALVEFPEDWAETDTLAIAQYLLDVFGRGGGGGEARNARLLNHLRGTLGMEAGDAAFDDFVWALRTDTYTTIKPGDEADPSWALRAADVPHDLSALDPAQEEAYMAAVGYEDVDDALMPIHETMAKLGWPFKMGSNAQLLSSEFSTSGKPILFGGPQMSYFAPMIPYELGLHGAGFDAVGMGVAGAPGVIIGRAASHSWTVTSGSVDQVDLVVERLVDDPYHYQYGDDVLEMDCRTETHYVRPGPADMAPGASTDWRPPLPDVVTQEVCRTIHGPVLGRTADGQYAFASYRSYRGDEARSGTLWLQVGQTKDADSFQALFETFRFTFNFNYADEAGNIMYLHLGAQPIRDDRLDPRLPMPGWDPSYDWKGFDIGSALPNMRNPASGYTVNWNNNPAPFFPSGDQMEKWGKTQRAQLMEATLLAAITDKGTLTMDDLRAINEHASTHDPYADDTHPLLHAAAVALGDTDVIDAVEEWAETQWAWTPDPASGGDYHYKGFRLYELWRTALQERVFDDELATFVHMPEWDPPSAGDPHAANHGEADMPDQVLHDTMAGDASRNWCDNITTGAEETCADQALAALEAAIADGTWDEPLPLRQSKFVALGAAPGWSIPMTNRPSFQHFYDWGLPEGDERSRNVLPPGASGHLSSLDYLMVQGYLQGMPGAALPPHLADQLQMYIDFEDKPLLYHVSDVEAYEESRIVFGAGA